MTWPKSIVVLLALDAVLLAYEAWHLGLTADEPSHFAAAHQYWLGNDVLEPSDTPPLMRMISGWAPLLLHAPIDKTTPAWRDRDAYQIGADTLASLDAVRARRLLFLTRLPFLAFPLGIVFLVWRWARDLWNDAIALGLAVCAALEPTILGHGALIKSDVAAAFGALLFAYAAWRYWNRPALRSMWWMIAALVIAVLAKFNLMLLVPVALVLLLIKGPRLAGAIAIPLAVYFTILASYQFRAAQLRALPGIPGILRTSNLATKLPWPDQFVRGVLYIANAIHNGDFRGWMLGHRIEGRALGYYPLAWAIKTPVPLQLLLLAGIAALALRLKRRKAAAADAFLWGSAAFYFATAMFSNYHIGIRHILPAIPFFILAGGFAIDRWVARREVRWAAAALLAWLAVSSLRTYPQGIAYFNEWIGGPENGWRYLADSNVDWGQNLPELGQWARHNPAARPRLYVFGLDSPAHYLRTRGWESPAWPGPSAPDSARSLVPAPGMYAVSTNMLTGIPFARGWEDYLSCFRDRAPIARAGYSILIYEVK